MTNIARASTAHCNDESIMTPLLRATGTSSLASATAPASESGLTVEEHVNQNLESPFDAGVSTTTSSVETVVEDKETCRSISASLCTLISIGFSLGLLSTAWQWYNKSASSNHDEENHTLWFWSTLSVSLGYTYVIMWSISFYPQLVTNYKRQATTGLSVDFCCLNVLGFLCYTIYNVALYSSPSIRREYQERHGASSSSGHNDNDVSIPVQFNDVVFAVHALIVSSATVGQIIWYNRRSLRRHFDDDDDDGRIRQRQHARQPQLSRIVVGILIGTLVFIVAYPTATVVRRPALNDDDKTTTLIWNMSPLDYLYVLSYIKMGITFVKYLPQMWLNARRQSTKGWSVWQILLDFGGGALSIGQLLLDCGVIQHDWSGLTGNLAKFGLGLISMAFDVIFLWQHFVLYASSTRTSTVRHHDDHQLNCHGVDQANGTRGGETASIGHDNGNTIDNAESMDSTSEPLLPVMAPPPVV